MMLTCIKATSRRLCMKCWEVSADICNAVIGQVNALLRLSDSLAVVDHLLHFAHESQQHMACTGRFNA